jgi:hypothetical protein
MGKKYTKVTTKYIQRPLNTTNDFKIPNGHKIYQNILLQGLKKYTKNKILGLKIYHLATIIVTRCHDVQFFLERILDLTAADR